jgi:hypothetical protein
MSIGTLIYVVSCVGFYKLGAYNQRQPEKMLEFCKAFWKWMNQS